MLQQTKGCITTAAAACLPDRLNEAGTQLERGLSLPGVGIVEKERILSRNNRQKEALLICDILAQTFFYLILQPLNEPLTHLICICSNQPSKQ